MFFARFTVVGLPGPGGSKRGFAFHRPNGKLGVSLVDAGGERTKAWRSLVRSAATLAMRDDSPAGLETSRRPANFPLKLVITFYLPRPAWHYKKGVLRVTAPQVHSIRPDATKLLRSTEDAMKGIVYEDDSLIYCQEITKLYADQPVQVGAVITVTD